MVSEWRREGGRGEGGDVVVEGGGSVDGDGREMSGENGRRMAAGTWPVREKMMASL